MTGGQSRSFRVEGPHDHPMWTYRNCRTGLVIGIGIAALCGTGEHVGNAGNCIGGLGFVRGKVSRPLQRCSIRTPGMQVKPLLPSRRTTVCPCASLSTIFADLAISGGPADMARSIFACTVSLVSGSTAECTGPASARLIRFVPRTVATTSIAARVAFFEEGLLIFFLLVRSQYDHAGWDVRRAEAVTF